MEHYIEMKARHGKEVSALPLGFAFGDKQFSEMMTRWGLDPDNDRDKICSVGGGGYIQRKDLDLLRDTFARHHREIDAAVAADKTGHGFICEMFVTEMKNHEYGYTGDLDDTLDALGLTARDVVDNPRLKAGMLLAHQRVMG